MDAKLRAKYDHLKEDFSNVNEPIPGDEVSAGGGGGCERARHQLSSSLPQFKRTPLMKSAEKGEAGEVRVLMRRHKADVDAKDKDGLSALAAAMLGGHQEVEKVLLDNGADKEGAEASLVSDWSVLPGL